MSKESNTTKTVYLICPVRGVTDEEKAHLDCYVIGLEAGGRYSVHYPPRDVDQTLSGPVISEKHRNAMNRADEIHVYWNPESKGSHFDLGMAYVLQQWLGKKVVVVNIVQPSSNGKTYADVLLKMANSAP